MQQMNKAMSQDTFAILGQVLTADQMEEIGLKWDDQLNALFYNVQTVSSRFSLVRYFML